MTQSTDLPPTRTLAALYEKQGLFKKAREVYRFLLTADPGQSDIREALDAMDARLSKKNGSASLKGESERMDADRIAVVLPELERWALAIRKRWAEIEPDGRRALKMLVILGPLAAYSDRDNQATPDSGTDVDEIRRTIARKANEQGVAIDMVHVSDGTEFVGALTEASDRYDALIVNPELLDLDGIETDRLVATGPPVFEVFFGHPRKDRPMPSPVSGIATGHLAGFGVNGLLLAVRAAVETVVENRARTTNS